MYLTNVMKSVLLCCMILCLLIVSQIFDYIYMYIYLYLSVYICIYTYTCLILFGCMFYSLINLLYGLDVGMIFSLLLICFAVLAGYC